MLRTWLLPDAAREKTYKRQLFTQIRKVRKEKQRVGTPKIINFLVDPFIIVTSRFPSVISVVKCFFQDKQSFALCALWLGNGFGTCCISYRLAIKLVDYKKESGYEEARYGTKDKDCLEEQADD
jgi:hypothetical protein